MTVITNEVTEGGVTFYRRIAQPGSPNWVLADDGTDVIAFLETDAEINSKKTISEFATEQLGLDDISLRSLNFDEEIARM